MLVRGQNLERQTTWYWVDTFIPLYIAHRVMSVYYYHTYKLAALRLADDKYYTNSAWLRRHVART